jgi:hypothetical protein
VYVALAVVLLVAAFAWGRAPREGIVTPEARDLCDVGREVFGQGDATFSAFKLRAPQVDPVQFTDLRQLWRDGRLSPPEVQRVM